MESRAASRSWAGTLKKKKRRRRRQDGGDAGKRRDKEREGKWMI